jgi:hypothetical protein
MEWLRWLTPVGLAFDFIGVVLLAIPILINRRVSKRYRPTPTPQEKRRSKGTEIAGWGLLSLGFALQIAGFFGPGNGVPLRIDFEGARVEWIVGGVAALATTAAAIASWRSANAARATTELVREEHEADMREKLRRPLINIRDVLAEYITDVTTITTGSEAAKGRQRQVRLLPQRHGLERRLPKSTEFARATMKELAYANDAYGEVLKELGENLD